MIVDRLLLKHKPLLRLARILCPRLGLRTTDIILATFPKSGTTWFRFIIANIASLQFLDGRVVDYHLLNGEMRGAFDSFAFPMLWPADMPRVLATHQIYNERQFGKNRRIYLYRNPGDVMVSFHEYRKSFKNLQRPHIEMKDFIRDGKYGIEAWCRHYLSWKDNANLVLSYEGLKKDTLAQTQKALRMMELSHQISIDVSKRAIERSTFERIRNIEETTGLDPAAAAKHSSEYRFAREGKVGGWKDRFSQEDIEYMANCLAAHGLRDVLDFTLKAC